jgi:hypothetical protein
MSPPICIKCINLHFPFWNLPRLTACAREKPLPRFYPHLFRRHARLLPCGSHHPTCKPCNTKNNSASTCFRWLDQSGPDAAGVLRHVFPMYPASSEREKKTAHPPPFGRERRQRATGTLLSEDPLQPVPCLQCSSPRLLLSVARGGTMTKSANLYI